MCPSARLLSSRNGAAAGDRKGDQVRVPSGEPWRVVLARRDRHEPPSVLGSYPRRARGASFAESAAAHLGRDQHPGRGTSRRRPAPLGCRHPLWVTLKAPALVVASDFDLQCFKDRGERVAEGQRWDGLVDGDDHADDGSVFVEDYGA
jgi:hypothetical protein